MLSLRRLCIISGIHCNYRLYRGLSWATSATLSSSVWPGSIQEAWPESKKDTCMCSRHMINLDSICLTCGQLPICNVCANTEHKDHQVKTMDTSASEDNERQIQTHKESKESITSILKLQIAAANDKISQDRTKMENSKIKIYNQLNAIKKQADRLADLYIKQCEQCESENSRSLQTYINHLQLLLDQTESDERSNGSIPGHFPTGTTATSSSLPEIPQTHFLQFKPSSESMEQFQKYFGDLLYCYSEMAKDVTQEESSKKSASDIANRAGPGGYSGQHTVPNTSLDGKMFDGTTAAEKLFSPTHKSTSPVAPAFEPRDPYNEQGSGHYVRQPGPTCSETTDTNKNDIKETACSQKVFQIPENQLHSQTNASQPKNEKSESPNVQNIQGVPVFAYPDLSNQANFQEPFYVHMPQVLSTQDQLQQRSISPYLSSPTDKSKSSTLETFANTNTSPGQNHASKRNFSPVRSVPQPINNDILVAGEGESSYETYSTSPPRQHIFPETIIVDQPKDDQLQHDARARSGNQNIFKNSKVTTNKGEQQVLSTMDTGYVKLSHEGKLILPDSEHRTIKSGDHKYDLPSPLQHRRSQADNSNSKVRSISPVSKQQRQYLETNLDEETITSKTKHQPMTLLKEYVFKRDLETRIKSLLPFPDQIYLWFLRNLRFTIIDKSTGDHHLEDINSISNIIDVYLSPVDNTLWFCCWDGSVWQITKQGGTKKRLTADQSVRAICVTHDGNVVVAMDVKITLYNINGRELAIKRRRELQLEEKTWKIADCGQTKRLAVSDKQNIAVMDYKLTFLFRIQKGHTVGWPSGAWSATGYTPIKLFEAWGLCFDADNDLLVCDTKNKCIVKFDKNGQYIRTVREVNMFPQSISRFDGHLYVAYTETSPMLMDDRMSKQTRRRMMTNTHLLPDISWHIQIFKE